ncbi:MAG TPA: hypothetical protein VNY31_09010, partial [Solirubrobacteraceae bacterium]|nr:hypothetical protein [Solirubrobacteraceae bacterium]
LDADLGTVRDLPLVLERESVPEEANVQPASAYSADRADNRVAITNFWSAPEVEPDTLPPVANTIARLELPDEAKHQLERLALESAIEVEAGEAAVRSLVERCEEVFALGEPAGDTSVPGRGTESNILRFIADDDTGKERSFIPIFTRRAVMRDALLRNPDWQTLSVLAISGRDLVAGVDSEVTLVINPWSDGEYQISSRA